MLATASRRRSALGSTLLADRIAALSQRAGFVVALAAGGESGRRADAARDSRCCNWWQLADPMARSASALFISTKTASVHVSNILAKLGVSGRGEAAAVAHRMGLTTP